MKKIMLIMITALLLSGCSNSTNNKNEEDNNLKVGDYIAYDAGTWTNEEIDQYKTTDRSEKQNQFYMYNVNYNQSKNDSVIDGCYRDNNKTDNSGWRVLNVAEDGTITIIHAGVPACYCVAIRYNSFDKEISNMDEFANANFLNNDYAQSARNVKCEDFFEGGQCGYGANGLSALKQTISEDMYKLGDNYWLTDHYQTLRIWDWNVDYNYFSNHSTHMYGIRPVVVLKSNVVLDGTGNGTKESPYGIKLK